MVTRQRTAAGQVKSDVVGEAGVDRLHVAAPKGLVETSQECRVG
jgi:hypothetical protein